MLLTVHTTSNLKCYGFGVKLLLDDVSECKYVYMLIIYFLRLEGV